MDGTKSNHDEAEPRDEDTESVVQSFHSSSTYTYEGCGHEPYDTFKHKICQLSQDIGAGEIELLDRIRGGSFNRVVPIAFNTKTNPTPTKAIFRVPRGIEFDEGQEEVAQRERVEDQVATFSLILRKSLPAPRIIAYDASFDNVIKTPFTLYELAEGTRLDAVYKTFSLAQKLQFADDFAKLLSDIEAVQFENAGLLRYARSGSDDDRTRKQNIGQRFELDVEIARFYAGDLQWTDNPLIRIQPTSSLTNLIDELLTANVALEKQLDGPNSDAIWYEYEFLRSAFEGMKEQGVFGVADVTLGTVLPNVLYHGDMAGRNILVTRPLASIDGQDAEWTINSVLDWDDARSVPRVLARQPPTWLWEMNSDELSINAKRFDDVDFDPIPQCSGNNLKIKSQFEEAFVRYTARYIPSYNIEMYHDEAYGRGRWIRRLWLLLLYGPRAYKFWERVALLEEEWPSKYTSHESPKISRNLRYRLHASSIKTRKVLSSSGCCFM